MSMPLPSIRVLALPVVFMFLALTPMSSLTFWVEGGSETIYSSPGFTVTYKPSILEALTRSNETRVKIEVKDHAGRPMNFKALLSGPGVEGVVDVGSVAGKGYAVKNIGRYVSEVKRVLRELNADPAITGLGMSILISTIIEENGEHYAAADAITIPIIPGKAIGKEIVVEVKFKPIMKYKITMENSSTKNYEQPQSQATPPRIVDHSCDYIGEYYICTYWELVETIYGTPRYALDFVPVAISVIDSGTGSLTKYIIHSLIVTLTRGDVWRLSLTASLGFPHPRTGTPVFYVTGEGFTRDIRSNVATERIYGIDCDLVPSPGVSGCKHLIGPGDEGWSSPVGIPSFYGDVLFSTGFLGKMWLARYRHVKDYYDYYGNLIYRVIINDHNFLVWVAPAFNEYGKIRAYWEVDDNPGYPGEDGGWGSAELLLNELKNHYTYKHINSTRGWHTLYIKTIYDYSQASPNFGAGIPAGAIILAILRALGMVPSLPTIILGIIASLAIGIIAKNITIKLYETLGFLKINLLIMDRLMDIYYAEIIHYYTIGDVQKIVPLIIFKPVARPS